MVADYYVNVNGRQVLYSSLDANLRQKLDQSGVTQTETARQAIDTVQPTQQQFYEQDYHMIDQKGEVVSVPGRYAERVGIRYQPPEEKKTTARERIAAKKKKKREEGKYFKEGSEEKTFSELDPAVKYQALKSVHPVELARQGILAPSENLFFRSKVVEEGKEGKRRVTTGHVKKLESNVKSYLLTGNIEGLNSYLREIAEREGPRAAKKEQSELIRMGIKHTSLELERQQGGAVGSDSKELRAKKEAKQRKSARVLAQGQKELAEARYGPLIRGEVGATFDERFPTTFTEYHGPQKPLWEVEGKTFTTREEAEKYAKSQQQESTVPIFLLPTPVSAPPEAEKSELKKSIESAYQFLETKSRDPKIKQDTEGSAIAVELGKTGLQIGAGILNLAESVDISVGRGYQKLRGVQEPQQQIQPISFPSRTADAIPISAIFEKGPTKEAAQQMFSESKQYIDTYGFKPYVAGISTNLIGGGGLVKGGVTLVTKTAGKVPLRIKAPVKSFFETKTIPTIQPKGVKVYPEIKSQVTLTPKQVEQAQGIMRRITTRRELAEKLYQPTILEKVKQTPLTASQKQVRIVAKKPTTVQSDRLYKPRGRNEGGFDDLLERGKTVDFKETKVPLGTAETRLPKPVKTDYSDQKFREFMNVAESGFERTPVKLGSSAVKKIKPQRQPDYAVASSDFVDFMKGVESTPRKYTKIVGEIKLSKDFIPNKYGPIENIANKPKPPVEIDPFYKNKMPLKRLGGKNVKRKSDIDKLLGEGELIGPIKETKVSLGKGTGFATKTKGQKDLIDFVSKLKGTKPRKAKTKFSDELPKGYKEIRGAGGSITLQKTEQIIKPQTIIKQQQKTEKLLKKKPKTPVGITWTAKQDTKLIPKPTSRPPVILLKPIQKQKKKQKAKLSVLYSPVIVESMLLSKDRPKLESRSKTKLKTGLSYEIYTPKLQEKQKLSSLLSTKPAVKQKAVLKQKPLLKEKQKEIYLVSPRPKLATKQTPRLKTRTPQRGVPKIPQRLITKQPDITITRQTTDTPPPPRPPVLLTPKPFDIKPKKKKKKKDKAGDDTELFLGSAYESSVLGFRSKKFDITYNKKSITRLLGEERKKFKRSEFTARGKSSISKGKAIKLKDRYSKVSLL